MSKAHHEQISESRLEFSSDAVESADGTRLFHRRWLAAGSAVRASVVFVHGLSEWGEPYAWIAEAVVARGFALHNFDLRGHGQSGGHRMYVESWRDFRADVSAVVDRARCDAPDAPVFLVGISMGGLIVLNFVLHEPDAVQGVVALGPAIGENGASRILKIVVPMLSRLWPTLALDPKLNLDNLAHDPEVVRAHITDAQYQVPVTARLGAEVLAAVDETRRRARDISLPMLVLHGGADEIALPEGSRTFVDAVGSPDKTFREVAGGYHAMLLDSDKEQVVADALDWIEARLGE